MSAGAGAPWHAIIPDDWPNCDTPDCENKQCRWAGTGLCHPCSVARVGREEMMRRYTVTHDREGDWTGRVAS